MVRSVLKHAAAVLLGVLILDLFCAWYYNPAPYQRTEDRATDKVRRPNAWTSQAKEGVGIHHMDENGYNNPPDAYGDGISVLMMGSSHTEAFNVPTEANASRQLEAMLRADGRAGRVYNIGISSHSFPHNAVNLARAVARFQPRDYVVIETDRLMFSARMITKAMEDRVRKLALRGTSMPDYISDRPLAKRLYRQYKALRYRSDDVDDDEAYEDEDADVLSVYSDDVMARYEDALTDWFSLLRSQAAGSGAGLIIYYHPQLTPQMDGTLANATNEQMLRAFSNACDRAGVIFIDMTADFVRAYEQQHVLPKGFANTAMGTGHLNRAGHRLVAEALYRAITEAEGAAQ